MPKKRKAVRRGKNAHGVRAVARKNKVLKQTYKAPVPAVQIIPEFPVRVIVPATVPVKVVKRQSWMEFLFGVTK